MKTRVRSILSELGEFEKYFYPSFDCHSKRLNSFEGIPKVISKNLLCYNNEFTSLHNIHNYIEAIGGFADFLNNPIKSNVLGLLKIEHLKKVCFDNKPLEKIMNKHLALAFEERDLFACQEDLYDAGLEEFAKL